MFGFFSALTFSKLLGLTGALSLPLLVLAYRKRIPQQRRPVSSLFLLRRLTKHAAQRRHIKLPLRFFLEFLALLLLTLALTQPYWRGGGERIALVVDNSMSMRAQPTGGFSRQQEAVERSRKFLASSGRGNSYTLFTSAPQLKQIGQSEVSTSAVEAELAAVQPVDSGDSLAGEVRQLALSGRFDQVIVVSDRNAELVSEGSGNTTSSSRTVFFTPITVGKPVANIGLTDLRTEHTESDDGSNPSTVALATIANHGVTPTSVKLSVFGLSAAQEQLLVTKNFSVAANKPQQLRINLGQQLPFKFLRAEIAPSENGGADSLPADNQGWTALEKMNQGTLLLVTSGAGNLLGLEQLKHLNTTRITPERFAELTPEQIKRYSLLLFHNCAPTSMPATPSLYILPPTGNLIFPVAAEERTSQVTSWNGEHPITQYLRVSLLRPAGTVVITPPAWAQSVINVERGAVVVAGEYQGVRHAAVGFELLPFEGGATPSLSVLTLNLLAWLSSQTAAFGQTPLTGTALTLNTRVGSWSVVSPTGETAAVGPGTPPYTPITPGLYQITERRAGLADATTRAVPVSSLPVNSFHPSESDTFNPQSYELPQSIKVPGEATGADLPLWFALVVIATIALAVEQLFAAIGWPQEA